ncbi:hypothetical protein MSG28_012348 [Choristoneura fumiferana]|uniref:Uncharacterized protein n=1 Tax=Choristoneura fumiferana TaxID=7141 RepID=A0ACC0KCR1_CHOFU|nr:hypothetical protein MSG28_012348 [Choristoneura fumiferana]
MKYRAIFIVVFLKIIQVENRMLPIHYVRATTENPEFVPPIDEIPNGRAIKSEKDTAEEPPEIDDGSSSEKVIGLRPKDEKETEDLGYNLEKKRRVVGRPNEVHLFPAALNILLNCRKAWGQPHF